MPGADHLRLVSFNILHGASPADGRVDTERFGAAIRRLDPDILALQEVDHHQRRSGDVDLTRVAAEAMAATASCFVPVLSGRLGDPGLRPLTGSVAGDAGYGIALLSRYPVAVWRHLRLPRLPTGYPRWRAAEHRLVRLQDEQRGVMLGRVETPWGGLDVINAHLSYVPGIREVQLLRLRARVRSLAGPLLVMGDLNVRAPWPDALLGLRPLARGLTIPAERPRLQIDHILARGPFRSVRTEAIDTGVSDHRALLAVVEWRTDRASAARDGP